MRVTMRMPSKKQYNLVTNDELDTRVPLHPDEAFTHGIRFSAKYIGTLDVPRPTSRVEIVAAMRRIRYEFKAKGIKKKKINLEVSVDGVKISLRKKKKQQTTNSEQLLIMTHPIYRIFYVSHDSQDLKIFSYIARDAASNVFRCHVFKANKKNQAMKVVRTVGQAFEVVHKLALKDKSPSPEPLNDDDISREGSEDSSDKPKKDGLDSESGQEDLMTLTSDTFNEELQQENLPSRPSKLEPLAPPIGTDIFSKNVGETFMSPLSEPLPQGDFLPQAGTPLSVHHELQLLREQLEQQQQQTQAAVAQVHLLRDQLAAETAARLEAQARTHQLLVHNKELLEHIQLLVLQVRELEVKFQGGPAGGNGVSTTISMPPNPPELKSELSPSSISGMSDGEASRPSLRVKPSSSPSSTTTSSSSLSPSQLLSPFPDTPPTPSPTLAAHTFFFPSSLHSSPQLSTLISPLPLHRQHQENQITHIIQQQRSQLQQQQQQQQQQQHQHQHPHQYLTQQQQHQQTMRQRQYHISHETSVLDQDLKRDSIDSGRRLPQVPEDSISTVPLGATTLGGLRGPPNGPITRAASERYSRQETLAQLQRMAWARHTTK